MASGKVSCTLLALAVFLNCALALPLKSCPAFECTGANDVLSFEPGKTYTYNLESQTSSVLSGATVPQGKLHLASEVTLQAVSACSAILTVKKPTVTNGNKKHPGAAAIEGTPVLIGIQNGQLVTEFCINKADSLASVNVKRAIASLFQVATEQKEYTDVFGACDVQTTVVSGDVTEVNSFRDLNSCKKRESIISSIPSSSYDFDANVQTAPVLKSSARLEQKLKSKVLESASGHEEYHFQPYSNEGNGAIITVSTNITLVSTTDGAAAFAAPEPTSVSVIFEAPHGSGFDYSNAKAIQAAIDDVCKSLDSSSFESAHLVRSLIQVVRRSSAADLLKTYNANKDKCGGKLILDALLSAATGQSVEALVKLAKSKTFTDLDLLYTSLAFNRHPTLASIKAVTTLIEKGSPPRNLVLGAGAFIGKYNELHGVEGGKEIDTLLERIARPLENCVTKTHDQEDKILTALKGLHNAHYVPDSITDKLKECASRKSSTRVRAAVLDTIQSDAANKKLKPVALEILNDREEDSELRIKAYLVAATCPCGTVLETVTTLLETEPVNQVGSFITTHLLNLRASTNPDKTYAKSILGAIKIPTNKFKYDYRRYSTNNELSFSLAKDGFAASAESNVIYSQKSFLPRSTDLNLTANVFGHSFNLLEVGLRAENLEHILEAYFGPKGYFKTHTPSDVLNTGNETASNLAQKIKDRATQSIRNRRAVDRAGLEKFTTKGEHDDKINVDLYIKLFGYELAFYSYYGNPSEFTPAALVDRIFDRVDNSIQTAKDWNINFEKNVQLFDTELVYPTFSGFPLKLSSVGTAAVKVELKSHFDLPAIVNDAKNTDIKFKFIPSATIEVASEFFVDFLVASAGLKHAATIHTSNGVDLTFKVLNGKGFDLNIGTPLAKQEILHIKSELFSTSRDKSSAAVQTPIVFTIPRKQYQGCFDQLSPYLGVTFCGDFNFPSEGLPKKNPFFPLDGPAEFFAHIKKDDASLQAYNINAKYHDETPDVKGWSLQFSTPAASNERLIKFFFSIAKQPSNLEYKLEFNTPIKSGYAAVKLIEEKKKQYAIDSILKMDTDEYKAKIGLTVIESSENTDTYKPELTYSGPNLEGKTNQYTVDGIIKHEKTPTTNKVTFIDVAVTVPKNKYQLDGFAVKKENGVEVDLAAKYNNPSESIILKGSTEYLSKKSAHLDVEFTMSKYPEAAFAVIYDGKMEENMYDYKLKVFHGRDLKSEQNCFVISHSVQHEKTGEKFTSLSTKNQISYLAAGIFLHFDADVVRSKSLHYILECGVDKQRLTSELSFKVGIPGPEGQQNPKDPGGYELGFKAGAGGQIVTINSGRQIVSPDSSKVQLSIELQPRNKVFKVDSDVIHRFEPKDLKLKLTSVFSATDIPDTYTVCTGVQSTPEQGEGHLKFTKGTEDLFVIKGETHHGDVETGKFELFLKEYLDGTGTFSHAKGKNDGSLDATFNSAKLNRKITVAGKLAQGAKPTTRDLSVTVLLDADKDPNKKVVVESSIDLLKDGRSFDTKTKVSVVDSTFVFNLKGVVPSRTPLENGVMNKIDGSLELPSKQVISVYMDLVQLQETEGKGVTTQIKFDDGKDYKLAYKGKYARADGFAIPTYNVDATLDLHAAQKDLNLKYGVENTDNSGDKNVVYKFDVTGTVLPQPFHSTFSAKVKDTHFYKLQANYGEKVAIDTDTTFNFQDAKDASYLLNFNMKSDFKGYEQVKYTSSYKGGFGDGHAKGDAKDYLEVANARVYDINAVWDYTHTSSECKGTTKVTTFLGATEKDARVFTATYELTGPNELRVNNNFARKFIGSVGLVQGATGFIVKVNGETPGDGTNSAKFGIELDSPIQNYEKIVLQVDHKSQKGGKLLETHIDTQYGNGDNRHFLIDGKVDLSEISRIFSVQITKADKTHVFKSYASYLRPSGHELQGELNLSVGGAKPRNLAVSGVAKYPGGFDDFDVVVNLDSEDMKLNKVRVHVDSKNTGKGRKVNISAKSADKTYIEGSSTYSKKEEGKATVYEGKGEVELNGEKYNSEGKLTHRILQKAKDSETGFDITLNGALTGSSKKTIDSQFLLTDKAMRVYTKVSGDKTSIVDVSNTLKIADTTEMTAENKITIDIEHTANNFALNLGSKYHRKNLEFEHKIEADLGKGDKLSKYVYEAFAKDRTAGLHLTTPKRTIAIDSLYSTPEKGKSGASQSYKGEVTVNFDKVNQPDQKLTLLSSFDINKGKDGTIYSSDLKISHPLIGKDLVFKGKTMIGSGQVLLDSSITLDVFAKKNQAIVVNLKNERVPIADGYNMTSTLTVTSKAQNLDMTTISHFVATKNEVGFGSVITCKDDKETRETAFIFGVNIDSLLVFVRSPSCEILRVHGDCKREQGLPPKSKLYLSFLETLALEGEILGFQSFNYQAYDKNHPEVRTIYSGAFELDKEVLLQADHVTSGASAKLFRLHIALDQANFLQTEQSLDADQLKVALQKLQDLAKAGTDRLTQCVADNYKRAEARAKVIFEGLKKAQPNLKPLIDRCKEQFEALQNELRTDPTINEVIDIVKNFVSGLAQAVTKFLQTLSEHVEKITTVLKEWASKFSELISKLTPVFTEAIGNVSKAFGSAITTFLEIFTKMAGKVLEALKANSGDIQKFFGLFAEFAKEQSKVIGTILNELREYTTELIKTIFKQIESQPVIDKVKVQYSELYKMFLERFDGVFAEIAENLKEILPNQELKNLAQAFTDYLTKKIKGENVDDLKELKALGEQFVRVFTALVNLPEMSGIPGLQGLNLENVLKFGINPVSFDSLTSLPQFTSLRVSLFELLSSSDLPSAADLFFTYTVPRRFDDALPPHRAFGIISGSKHFYTFDGSHYTLQGDCQYLLAKDFEDGTFSLTVELAGSQLRSVAYVDSKDTVEIKADHSVVINGQAAELPLHQNDVSIFRTLHTINVKSKYGVEVSCDLHHDLCTFAVNGYYFGKTRGLLGTITNEKYDDWTLPNGKIASNVAQFSNEYQLTDSCKKLAPEEHAHKSNDECVAAFSRPAPFSECYKFVDPKPYRQGCEDAIADANTPELRASALCDAAAAYVSKCRDTTFLQPSMPNTCAKCSLGDKTVDVGQSAVVKSPNGKADIVLLVEQTAENQEPFNELISPLSAQLKDDLAKQGITDINAVLIGYGAPGQHYPAFFTQNSKFSFDGTKPKQLTFGSQETEVAGGVSIHPLLAFLKRASEFSALELGLTPLAQAFRQVIEYPFRPDASKAVFLLRSSDCHKTKLPVALQQLTFLHARQFFSDHGITVALFQPIDITNLADKKFIGFDSENAFLNTKKGVDPAARAEVTYTDNCTPYIETVKPAVYSTKVFLEQKPGQRKQFVQSASSRLSTLLATETTQNCDCTYHEGLHSQAKCSVSATKSKAKKN